jgi:hypothetical protein
MRLFLNIRFILLLFLVSTGLLLIPDETVGTESFENIYVAKMEEYNVSSQPFGYHSASLQDSLCRQSLVVVLVSPLLTLLVMGRYRSSVGSGCQDQRRRKKVM